jgi:hypothetical protein
VLLQRAFTLLVLLIGIGLGISLGRSWDEVPAAEAARPGRAVFRCFGVAAVVHNPTNAEMRVTYEHLDEQGATTGSAEKVIAPRATSALQVQSADGPIINVAAPKAAYVAGITVSGLSDCQVGK